MAGSNSNININNLVVKNLGPEMIELTNDEINNKEFPEYLKIRGYKFVENQFDVIHI